MTERIRFRQAVSIAVIGVLRLIQQRVLDCRQLAVMRVGRRLGRLIRQRRFQHIAQRVVLVTRYIAQRVGRADLPAKRIIGIADACSVRKDDVQQIAVCVVFILRHVAQRVCHARQIAVRIIVVCRFIAQRIHGFGQQAVDIRIARLIAQRVRLLGQTAFVVVCVGCHAAIRRGFPNQIAVRIVFIQRDRAVQIGQLCNLVMIVVFPMNRASVFQHGCDDIARIVIGVGGHMPQRVRLADNFALLAVGKAGFTAQRIHNSSSALLLIKEIGNDISFGIRCYRLTVAVLHPIATVVAVLLLDNAILFVVFVQHLTLTVAVIPFGHAALFVVGVLRCFAFGICKGTEFVPKIGIAQRHIARRGDADNVSSLIHFDQQFFLTGRNDLRHQAVLIPDDLRNMLPIILFNAFQQTAGRKRIDCSIRQADSIFGMRRVVGEGFILR